MKVILLQDVEFVGLAHELVEVKNGFARNYLIPKRFAEEVTKASMARLEGKRKAEEKKQAELLEKINTVIEVLKSNPIQIKIKTGTSGRIFGKVTTLQVAKALKDQIGYQIDKKLIELPEMINVGTYTCKVHFNKGKHIAEVQLNLVA